eukprot:GEMP01045202.1.p1 GENE.GEMP01045202.1~~GEMP01045202.1.p1  ORF type:complete len:307 (+),score=80.06 GEMP01045202.1:50-922(+)
MDDELQEIRDHFFIGSFTRALELITRYLNEPRSMGDINAAELGSIKARTHLGLRKFGELKALKDSPNPGEQATSQMTIFLNSNQEKQKEDAGKKIIELATSTKDINATNLAAAYLAHQGDYVEAFNLTKGYDTVEMMALRAQIYLCMSRQDLATDVVNEMYRLAEDAAITKMTSSLLNIAKGNYQEAFLTYCDIQALYGEESMTAPSSILLNAKAACNLHRGMYTEAQEDTVRALDLNPRDSDALVNLIAIHIHLKEDHAAQFTALKEKFPLHPLVQKAQTLDTAFAAFS